MAQAIDHAEKLYGKPKPKFVPQVRIEGRPVDGVESKGHLYLVYRNEDGKEVAISARPKDYGTSTALISNLMVEVIPINESIDARGTDTPKQRGSIVLSSGEDAKNLWINMAKTAKEITESNIDYDVLGPNSNSAIQFILNEANIKPEENIPNVKGLDHGLGLNKFPSPYKLVRDENGKIRDISSIEYPNPFNPPPEHLRRLPQFN
ncbi:MAG: hypothetical protein V7776_12060 [Halopseudomonas aestusnigri]